MPWKIYPPTSVESERAFSAAGLFITKLRTRLSVKNIDALCFLRNYYKKQLIVLIIDAFKQIENVEFVVGNIIL